MTVASSHKYHDLPSFDSLHHSIALLEAKEKELLNDNMVLKLLIKCMLAKATAAGSLRDQLGSKPE